MSKGYPVGSASFSNKLLPCLYFRPHDGNQYKGCFLNDANSIPGLALQESRPFSELCFLLGTMGI